MITDAVLIFIYIIPLVYMMAKIKTLQSCVIDLLWICDQADFKNGNTDGVFDEGVVLASSAIKNVEKRSGVRRQWS